MEIQQSKPYAQFITSLGWNVVTDGRQYYYLKRLPFLGALLKIQRVRRLPQLRTLLPILKAQRVARIAIEPDRNISATALKRWRARAAKYVHISRDHFLQTKSIRVDLSTDEDTIFRRFSEAKRRAVRRAAKNGIHVEVTQDINAFIKLKNTSAGFLGFITTYGLDKLWHQFAPHRADILIAYTTERKPVGGIFLLYWQHMAYYWVAGATKEGKKLFAPTLLIWEALRQAKKHGCTAFDFVGVWDERMPDKYHEWKGFTKFKEGFGGTELYYPLIA